MSTPGSHEEGTANMPSSPVDSPRRTIASGWPNSTAAGRFNQEFFDGRLVEPHLAIDRTAPRSLGHCARNTGYGGRVQITLNSGLVFGSNPDWVVRAWPPAEGVKRFIDDFLLRYTVRQFVVEVHDAEERGYRGFGPRFVEQANRIGVRLGVGPVVERRREAGGRELVANGWPHCVRPAGYYGDDVTEAALELARGVTGRRRATTAPSQGLLELIQFLLNAGRVGDCQQLVARHLEWVRALRQSRWHPRRRVEAGSQDVDGSPLGTVTFHPDWLKWNDGTVRKIAEGIVQFGNFADLPILADALEEAGCTDGRILRHLRARMEHGRRCWVLRLLLALDAE